MLKNNILQFLKQPKKLWQQIDLPWLVTLIGLVYKNLVLLAIILDKTHFSADFGSAFGLSLPYIVIYLGCAAFIISFALLMKGKARFFYLLAANLLITFLLLVDTWYFRGFNDLPTPHILMQSSNLNNMSEGILSIIYPIDILYLLDLPLFLGIAFLCRKVHVKNRNIFSFIAIFVLSSMVLAWVPLKTTLFKDRYVDSNVAAYKLSPLGYHALSVYSYIKDSTPVSLTTEENDEIRDWFKQKQEYIPDNEFKGMFKGKNLIHIDIESLENFVIGQKVNGQEITPNLNRLLKNGLYFSNIHEQVNQGNSSDADLLVNTSVYPIRKGSVFYAYPNNSYNSMPKLMSKAGYSTIALHPDEGSFWNWMEALTAIGFEKRVGAEQLVIDETFFLGITDGSFLRQAEEIIARQKQPFHAFMPTQSSHSPFDIPEKYRELKLEDHMANTTLGLYFQSVHYADKCIGAFIDALERDNLLDNTVVVLCGDHAGITKYHPGEAEKVKPSEDWWLVQQRQIPFIIYQKDAKPQQISTIGGQIDILPTVAYVMGIDEEEYNHTAMGRNLLKTKKSFAVLANGEFIGENYTEKEKEHAVKGLEIADVIIKSNYFKDRESDK